MKIYLIILKSFPDKDILDIDSAFMYKTQARKRQRELCREGSKASKTVFVCFQEMEVK